MVNSRNTLPENNRIKTFLLQSYKRFGQDLVGILLISLAVITALSLFGLSTGIISKAWTDWIARGFGWGVYILIGFIIFVGSLILFRRIEQFPKLNLSRIVSLEISLLTLLAVLSAVFGYSVERAHLGMDGGVIGWGLAHIFESFMGKTFTLIVLLLIWIFSSLDGLGLLKPLNHRLDQHFADIHAATSENTNRVGVPEGTPAVEPAEFAGDEDNSNEEPAAPSVPQRQLKLPPLDLLLDPQSATTDEPYIHAKAIQIEKTLEEFGVPARVAGYRVDRPSSSMQSNPAMWKRSTKKATSSARKCGFRKYHSSTAILPWHYPSIA
jgi:S-DNA-T family DNA segregation ATPase FtsK/SpoIIIE